MAALYIREFKDNPMFSAYEIFDIAVKLEKNGENVYRYAQSRIANIALRELLAFMAEEEQKHAELFSRLQSEIQHGKDHHIIKEMSESLVEKFVGDQSFSLKDVDFTQVETIRNMIDVFIDFEKNTILFYEILYPFITDEHTLTTLNQIIGEEKNHIEQFQKLLSGTSVHCKSG